MYGMFTVYTICFHCVILVTSVHKYIKNHLLNSFALLTFGEACCQSCRNLEKHKDTHLRTLYRKGDTLSVCVC